MCSGRAICDASFRINGLQVKEPTILKIDNNEQCTSATIAATSRLYLPADYERIYQLHIAMGEVQQIMLYGVPKQTE
jgi:hypothetical protein